MVVRSLNTKTNPCSKAEYNGKRACIEQKVIYFRTDSNFNFEVHDSLP